tara:strand:- start:75 stop:1121 length:1047 start_codon:yes stop_codon:yes gene_type:complete
MTTETNNAIVTVKNLATHFPLDEGNVVAVDGASFEVPAGKTVGIVGESGCGKSVTARSILGILDDPGHIVSGEILYHREGKDGTEGETIDLASLDPDSKEFRSIRGSEVSYIFQEPMTSFSPVHTIGNQLMEAVRLHRDVSKSEAKDIAIDMLTQVGIPLAEQRVNQYSFELSGGLRQRAMIAMALANVPRLVIADEPTTALDVTTQAQILDLMRGLQEQYGMGIMMITHDLGVIADMCEEVVVMYLGRVVERGSVDEIFHSPKHPYTKALLESIPRLRGDAGSRLSTIEGSVPHPYDRPPGCPFNTRCSDFKDGICNVAEPQLASVESKTLHEVSCFLYHDAEGSPV